MRSVRKICLAGLVICVAFFLFAFAIRLDVSDSTRQTSLEREPRSIYLDPHTTSSVKLVDPSLIQLLQTIEVHSTKKSQELANPSASTALPVSAMLLGEQSIPPLSTAKSPTLVPLSTAVDMNKIEKLRAAVEESEHAINSFYHLVAPLPLPPQDSPAEAFWLHNSFERFRLFPKWYNSTCEVYSVGCVHNEECLLIWNHWQSLRKLHVGHITVLVGMKTRPTIWKNLTLLADLFPGRFSLIHMPEGFSISTAWNTMCQLGFSIAPTPKFVQIANADLWGIHNSFAVFIYNVFRRGSDGVYLHKYQSDRPGDWSHFAISHWAWKDVGAFDEGVFPSHGEDIDYEYRLQNIFHRLTGRRTMPHVGNGQATTHPNLNHYAQVHKQQFSWKSKDVETKASRFARWDYLSRKWNHWPGSYVAATFRFAFPNPFNLSWLSPFNASFPDPVHQRCVREGAKSGRFPLLLPLTGCLECGSCYWNATTALAPYMPPNATLPDWLTSQYLNYMHIHDKKKPPPVFYQWKRRKWGNFSMTEEQYMKRLSLDPLVFKPWQPPRFITVTEVGHDEKNNNSLPTNVTLPRPTVVRPSKPGGF